MQFFIKVITRIVNLLWARYKVFAWDFITSSCYFINVEKLQFLINIILERKVYSFSKILIDFGNTVGPVSM